MSDILFHTENYVFSYRVAGIFLRDGKILLQKTSAGTEFALPGGHVMLGETTAQTLEREFAEEIGADISVGQLKWVEEVFWKWGDKPCHQICLYYDVSLKNEAQIPLDDMFLSKEYNEKRNYMIEFHWMPREKLEHIKVYPVNIAQLIKRYNDGVQHFVYREDGI